MILKYSLKNFSIECTKTSNFAPKPLRSITPLRSAPLIIQGDRSSLRFAPVIFKGDRSSLRSAPKKYSQIFNPGSGYPVPKSFFWYRSRPVFYENPLAKQIICREVWKWTVIIRNSGRFCTACTKILVPSTNFLVPAASAPIVTSLRNINTFQRTLNSFNPGTRTNTNCTRVLYNTIWYYSKIFFRLEKF